MYIGRIASQNLATKCMSVAKEGKVFEPKKLLIPLLDTSEGTKITWISLFLTSPTPTVYSSVHTAKCSLQTEHCTMYTAYCSALLYGVYMWQTGGWVSSSRESIFSIRTRNQQRLLKYKHNLEVFDLKENVKNVLAVYNVHQSRPSESDL